MQSRAITEQRLQDALDRLLNSSPINVKRSGKLTLNKINREAGLGNSYIHKFPDFVERVKPQIEEFNSTEKQAESEIILDESNPDEVTRLKAQLKKEKRLKEQYRTERDESKKIQQAVALSFDGKHAPKVTATGKTKVVLGYTCKQYIVSVNKDGQTVEMDLFTTEAITIASQQTAMLGNKIKGFPLYSVMKMNQMGVSMTITTEVTEIKKDTPVDIKKFSMTPPEGYEKMNQ